MKKSFVGCFIFILFLSILSQTSFAGESKKDVSKKSGAAMFANVLQSSPGKYKTTASLWELRASVALVKMDQLTKEMDDIYKRTKADKNKPTIDVIGKKLSYETMLEFAYASHADPRQADIVHKKDDGLDFYKIILNIGGKDRSAKDSLFVLNYIYDSKTDQFIASKIELLPKGWYVNFMKGTEDLFLLADKDGDGFAFHLANPFLSGIVVSK
jgi:hypothetical protein